VIRDGRILNLSVLPQSVLAQLCDSGCGANDGLAATLRRVLAMGVSKDGDVVRIAPGPSANALTLPVAAEDMFGAGNLAQIIEAIDLARARGSYRLQLDIYPKTRICVRADALVLASTTCEGEAVCDLILMAADDCTAAMIPHHFRYLERVADDARDGLIITDSGGTILHISVGATELFGYSPEKIVGKPIDLLMPEPYRSRHAQFVSSFQETGQGKILGVGPRELPAMDSEGRTFPIELSVSKAEWDGQHVLIGMCRDISTRMMRERALQDAQKSLSEHVRKLEQANAELDRQQAEARALAQRLKAARDEARAANSAKSDFLATMSHEIRTPLNGIIGMVQVLATSKLDAEQRENLSVIAESSDTLLALLNELLDLSKIESGKMTLEPRAVDLQRFLDPIADHWHRRAKAKSLTFEIDVAADMPQSVTLDPVRLRQVLDNLLSNAIKFTEAGAIRLALSAVQSKAGGHGLRLTVADTGIGIAPENLDRIFDSFMQADTSITRKFGGTGLGLAITKRLVGLMDGMITVASTPGSGTEFAVHLPCHCTAEHCTAKSSPVVESVPTETTGQDELALHVLVAEDNVTNQKVIRAILGAMGHEVTIAGNGREAIEYLVSGAGVDVVLMDLHMPEMDGLAATRAIRARRDHIAQVPIIGLTASAMDKDRELCLAAGMSDFVTKPVKVEALATALAQAELGFAAMKDFESAAKDANARASRALGQT
jgi:PAS domain S-box-containing protein